VDIAGIGTEIVECVRIGRMIEQHGELFLARVYTEREIRDCQQKKKSLEHFAGRWAAKEAVLKALGTAWRRGLAFTDIEIQPEDNGTFTVRLLGAAREVADRLHIAAIHLSIAHCRAYATAYVLAVRT
jgi:holo-[acyl-carrier protein] synthase